MLCAHARRGACGLPLELWEAELTRAPRGLRRVRTGYAYQPPALGTYRRRREACPQGPAYSTYGVRVPALGVRYVPRTVAPQVGGHTRPHPARLVHAQLHGGRAHRARREGAAGRKQAQAPARGQQPEVVRLLVPAEPCVKTMLCAFSYLLTYHHVVK